MIQKLPKMSWWEPIYEFNDLETEWGKSLAPLAGLYQQKTEEELSTEVTFIGLDDSTWAATRAKRYCPAVELPFHTSLQAQMQTLLRQQGVEPGFVDYIGTKHRKLS